VYIATTHDPVTDELVERLKSGVQLHDEPAPLAAQSCRQLGTRELEIVLEQGKYHQVKRMLAAAGNHCSALRRSAIGKLVLDELALEEGEWCYLDEQRRALLVPD
jgi:16S rRNA pseudouridine516 synthase